jgi:tRNA A37 threonylcarbamoyladenosine dehydratase
MQPYERRFGGIGRLYGREGLERLRRRHVCVIGPGGLGSAYEDYPAVKL